MPIILTGEQWDDFWESTDDLGPYVAEPVAIRPLEQRHHPLCPSPDHLCRCRDLYDKDYES